MGVEQSQPSVYHIPTFGERRFPRTSNQDQQLEKDLEEFYDNLAKVKCLEHYASHRYTTLYDKCLEDHKKLYRTGFKLADTWISNKDLGRVPEVRPY